MLEFFYFDPFPQWDKHNIVQESDAVCILDVFRVMVV